MTRKQEMIKVSMINYFSFSVLLSTISFAQGITEGSFFFRFGLGAGSSSSLTAGVAAEEDDDEDAAASVPGSGLTVGSPSNDTLIS
jgi:hypothetical protein